MYLLLTKYLDKLIENDPGFKSVDVKNDTINVLPKDVVIKFPINFGLEINFDPSIKLTNEIKFRLFFLVIKRKYYFSPDNLKFDFNKRIIYTIDNKISLKLNLNFLNIDIRYLYFIITLLQLRLFNILETQECDYIITLICEYLNIKYKYESMRRIAILKRFINGKEVESIYMILTDEKFTKEVENQLSLLKIKLTKDGFSKL